MNVLAGFAAAFRTLTILPFPGPGAKDDSFRKSLIFFPLVGVILAASLYGVFKLCLVGHHLPPLVCGLFLAASNIILTGALHLDGLADVCDGFGGGTTREKIIEIFKDPRHGTFGVTAIVLDILAKVAIYAYFVDHRTFAFVALSLVISRSLQAGALTFLPYAGVSKGIAGAFTGTTRRILSTGSVLLALGACCVVHVPTGAMAVAISGCAGAFFLSVCMKKIGGITGDCVGALSEVAEISVIIVGLLQ
jgi:adenosylcobinamide-GDP ribazoletransferase